MTPRHLLPFLLSTAAATAAAGCFTPFSGLEGEWTRGELGNTQWQIMDGLCPGLGGGCSLETPLAVGAHTRLLVDGIDGVPITALPAGAIAEDGDPLVSEDSRTQIPIVATSEGTGRLEILDGATVIDRVGLTVRAATRLECGRWDTERATVQWRMEGLEPSSAITLPSRTDDRFELVCRASDAEGPLLSADAIQWETLDGLEHVSLLETGFATNPVDRAEGARIRYRPGSPGVAHVRASLGELTALLEITVE
jgi:hypothetical protein